jgi:hypothetical protein
VKKRKDFIILNTRFLSLILSLFTLSGCSSFLNLFKNEPNYKLKPTVEKQHYCYKKNKLNIAHQNKDIVKTFEKIHLNISKKYRFSFSEKAVLWSLLQLAFSPNNTSPSSRFQVILGNKESFKIFDFNKKDPRLKLNQTFLDGLQMILKSSRSNRSLRQILSIAQNEFPLDVEVDDTLARFIQNNRAQLQKSRYTRKAFFKAKNPLQPGETFRRLNFDKLNKLIKKTNHRSQQAPLFPIELPSEITQGSEVDCNMDLNLYARSIYLLDKEKKNNNIFALYTDSGEFFIGITTLSPNWKPLYSNYLISSEQVSKPQPICILKKEFNKKAVVISFKDRDPGQHIFHLLQYGLTSARENNEFFEFIKYPRHQFLLSPPRLTFESSRGSTKQLQSLLKLNFPVYNASSLAEVWVFNQMGSSSLITDDRNHTYQSCHIN